MGDEFRPPFLKREWGFVLLRLMSIGRGLKRRKRLKHEKDDVGFGGYGDVEWMGSLSSSWGLGQ